MAYGSSNLASAFEGCTSLEEAVVDYPYLNSYTFMNCTSLKRISLREEVNTLPQMVFANCYQLELNFLDHIKRYDRLCLDIDDAYPQRENTIVEFSSNVEYFYMSYTRYLMDLYIDRDLKGLFEVGKYLISFKNVYYLDENGTIEHNGKTYSTFSDTLYVPRGIISINPEMFYMMDIYTDIYIPRDVTNIGSNAFKRFQGRYNVHYEGTEEEWANVNLNKSKVKGKNAYVETNHLDLVETELVLNY